MARVQKSGRKLRFHVVGSCLTRAREFSSSLRGNERRCKAVLCQHLHFNNRVN